ncbi:MAG: thiamine phosphate synthase [Phycisphaerales bacterium]|nr:thiamine phosphate synthase [Phycisphaerales bacterium]
MDPTLRILDAAANRAREALRVMEDAARFAAGHAALTEDLKELRHGLVTALEDAGLGRTLLAAHRDTPGDVGTGITAPAESSRAGLRTVALAAGARAGEALRSVEECAKALGGRPAGAAPVVEALRYRLYSAEQTLILALGSGRVVRWRLCVLITESLCARPWLDVAAAAIKGGADCLQLREKNLEDRELLARARALVAAARGATVGHGGSGTAVIINDRPDIALAAGADGVHLGQTDLPVRAVRELAGARLIVGVSTSCIDEARSAVRDGADYLGLGPMFATTTKDKPELRGPPYLHEVLADSVLAPVPHLAIGGITAINAGELVQGGCRGVAVSGAVCGAEDPRAACAAIVKAWENSGRNPPPNGGPCRPSAPSP